MTDATIAALRDYAALHGLKHLPDDQLIRLREMAARAAAAGNAVPRQPSKWTEPAGVFRVLDASR